MLEFRNANYVDFSKVLNLYAAATDDLHRAGIDQWDEEYPDSDYLEEAMKQGQLQIAYDRDVLVAAYILNREDIPGCELGRWQYTGEDYRVLHVLCINPAYQHEGLGAQTLQQIEEDLKQQGVKALRLGVYPKNPYAVNLYDHRGYHRVAEVPFDGEFFYLLEKVF